MSTTMKLALRYEDGMSSDGTSLTANAPTTAESTSAAT
jgi:hypothetical protein